MCARKSQTLGRVDSTGKVQELLKVKLQPLPALPVSSLARAVLLLKNKVLGQVGTNYAGKKPGNTGGANESCRQHPTQAPTLVFYTSTWLAARLRLKDISAGFLQLRKDLSHGVVLRRWQGRAGLRLLGIRTSKYDQGGERPSLASQWMPRDAQHTEISEGPHTAQAFVTQGCVE